MNGFRCVSLVISFVVVSASCGFAQSGTIATVAGTGTGGYGGDGGPAVSAQLNSPHGVAVDATGNLFIAELLNGRIRKVTPNGIISTAAGNGTSGFSGDGGPAVSAQLKAPVAVAMDATGNLFIADAGNNRIRKVTRNGIISTVAGMGTRGFSGDGGPAVSAQLNNPYSIAVDAAGNLFIADVGNNRIRKVTPDGVISTFAGTGTQGFSGDGGPAISAQLKSPWGAAVDAVGNLFIADEGNTRIRKVTSDGVISTVAGTGTRGFSGDGGPAVSAQLDDPVGVAVDGDGNLFIADRNRIREVTPNGVISTVAGTGTDGFSGDSGPAVSAQLKIPQGVGTDAADNIFIADTFNNRVRKVTLTTSDLSFSIVSYFIRTGISDVRSFLQRCPNSDPAYNLIRQDFELRRNGSVITSPINCTEPASSMSAAQITDELIAVQLFRTAYYMGMGTEGYLPWTQKGLYSWMAANVAGINFRADSGPFYCCDVFNGKKYVSAPTKKINLSWHGIAISLTTYAHEVRHAEAGFRHTTGCPFAPLPTDPLECDATYDVNNLSPYGIEYWLESKWATSYLNIGIGCSPSDVARDYALGDQVRADFLHPGHFANPPPLVTATQPYGGPCIHEGPPSFVDSGGVSFQTAGTAPTIKVGYASIQPNAGSATPTGVAIFGLRQNNVLVTEAGVPASPLIQSGRIYAEVNDRINTGVAIANPNNQPAAVSFFFTNSNGDLGSGNTTIPANGQIAKFINEAPFSGPSSFGGTFTFSSSIPIAVAALRGLNNERGEFLITTLPVADLGASAAIGPIVLPQFADGAGLTTQIILVNPTGSALTGTVQFLDSSGRAASLVVNGQSDTTFAYSIPARSSQKLQTPGLGSATLTGSVRVVPATNTTAPSALAVFSIRNGGITVSEAGVPAVAAGKAFRLYAETAGSIETGIAVVNTSAGTAAVTLELRKLDGSATGLTGTLSIPSNGQTSVFLNEIQGLASLPIPFQGILRLLSSASISVIGLRARYNERNEFLMTTIPTVNEAAAPYSSPLFFPYIVDSGGSTSQLILLSAQPGSSSSGTMRFLSQTGSALNLMRH